MKKFFVLVLLLLFKLDVVVGCSCGGKPTFCETSKYSLAVLEVEVSKKYSSEGPYFENFIDFKVKKTLTSKDSILYDELTLYEGGSSCDIYLYNRLEKGDKLVILYDHVGSHPNANYPIISFYICANYFLRIEKGKVSGDITSNNQDGEQTFSYAKFKEDLLDLCEIDESFDLSISIRPNLTENEISIKSEFLQTLNFEIFSASGQLIYESIIHPAEEKIHSLGDIPSGIYFIRFRNDYRFVIKKVMKIG